MPQWAPYRSGLGMVKASWEQAPLLGTALLGLSLGMGWNGCLLAYAQSAYPTTQAIADSPVHGAPEDVLDQLLPDILAPVAPQPPPPRPGRRPSNPVSPPLPPPSQRSRPPQPAPDADPAPSLSDPADQTAPAVIDLPPSGRPPSLVVFLAMQQELKNLVGRLESALLMVNSQEMPTTLTLPTEGGGLATAESIKGSGTAPLILHPALTEAQQLLAQWDELLAAGQHNTLRDRWVAVRDQLWASFPQNPIVDQAEIRAVWLDRGTIVAARSPAGLAQVFDRLAAAGITTVFFETVNAGYPIYPSRVAPEQNPLTREWDPLAAAVTLAHQRQMTLHAWVWVFAAGNQRHNQLLNLPLDYPGPLLARHPDWAAYDNHGNLIPRGQDKPFLDPANPRVRRYLTELLTEIVSEYAVDGVHLDYIRYPFQDPGANRTYGYGEVARWQFQSLTGVDPINLSPRPDQTIPRSQQIQQQALWDRWTDYRIQQVNSFVETIASTLKRQRPRLVMSAAVFANGEHDRQQRIQQDWGTWAQAGYLDWIVLMSYAADTSRFDRLVRPWLINQTFGSTLVIPGIRLLSLSNRAALDQIQVSRDLPTPGYALFAAADFGADFHTLSAPTPGNPSPTPQTPYQMAFSRYQTLQREWHWLLAQQKLWMDRDRLPQWVEAANRLEAEFQALAESPSRRRLAAVQADLAQVRAPISHGALVNTANSSYRLQSWQHRLTTIEQLLNYGDRSSL